MFLIYIIIRRARPGQMLGLRLRRLRPYVVYFRNHCLYVQLATEVVG